MNIEDLKPEELLRYGIDERTVKAIQLRFMNNFGLNKDGEVIHEKNNLSLEDTKNVEETSSSKDQSSINEITHKNLIPFSLDNDEITKSIQLSVCCCAFFYGFIEIDQQSIDDLSKTLDGKLNKMCEQLKLLGDRLKKERPAEFKNPVHQVLEMHLLPVQTLFDFYRSRVLAPLELLIKQQNKTMKNKNIKNDGKKQGRKRKREIHYFLMREFNFLKAPLYKM
ncbi:hypothetical protein Mgra_00006489 [Meloidogyne graminicola]|uniref:Uncharacterized protein n=1 Tax=Meloidogyne graminicola TaxID=189291 RepID=A0A8S9ZLF6_9BILA|nr:hypothetical protein Mgra_00006489 [Meloidogyne graminicola]